MQTAADRRSLAASSRLDFADAGVLALSSPLTRNASSVPDDRGQLYCAPLYL